MKLRIRGNSLRLRLTKSEVNQFVENGRVTDSIRFGTGETDKLSYSLISTEKSERLVAEFDRREISIFVPSSTADAWTQTEQVGFEAEQELGDGENLTILVEKDFVCLTERKGEDESDNFPHPKAKHPC